MFLCLKKNILDFLLKNQVNLKAIHNNQNVIQIADQVSVKQHYSTEAGPYLASLNGGQ